MAAVLEKKQEWLFKPATHEAERLTSHSLSTGSLSAQALSSTSLRSPQQLGTTNDTLSYLASDAMLARVEEILSKPDALKALAQDLAYRVGEVLDHGVCFALVHDCDWKIGSVWQNWSEYPFEIASESVMLTEIEHWMNAQEEWIYEALTGVDAEIPVPGFPGIYAVPDDEDLQNAWSDVLFGTPEKVYELPIINENKQPMGYRSLTAGEMMHHLGLSVESLHPIVVIADLLSEPDLDALQRDEDDVYLDGYTVTSVETDHDVMFVHIRTNRK